MKFQDHFGLLSASEREHIEKLLERFKNPISIEQIADGIRVTLLNARQLYEDAIALLQMNRNARSMALLVAAMEELGKVSVLAGMSRIPNSNQKLWADSWQSFRNHEHKSTWAIAQTYPDEARAFPSVMTTAAAQQFSLAALCERLRQYGLYVDFHAADLRWRGVFAVRSNEMYFVYGVLVHRAEAESLSDAVLSRIRSPRLVLD